MKTLLFLLFICIVSLIKSIPCDPAYDPSHSLACPPMHTCVCNNIHKKTVCECVKNKMYACSKKAIPLDNEEMLNFCKSLCYPYRAVTGGWSSTRCHKKELGLYGNYCLCEM